MKTYHSNQSHNSLIKCNNVAPTIILYSENHIFAYIQQHENLGISIKMTDAVKTIYISQTFQQLHEGYIELLRTTD